MKLLLILGALILAGCAILGCASPRSELALKGRVFPMAAEDCARIAAKAGGVCYGN